MDDYEKGQMLKRKGAFRDEDGVKVLPREIAAKQDNKWLDGEARDLYNKARPRLLRYKGVEWEDVPAKVRVHFKLRAVIERKKSGELVRGGTEGGNPIKKDRRL